MRGYQQRFLDTLKREGALDVSTNPEELFELESGRLSPYKIQLRHVTSGKGINEIGSAYGRLVHDLITDGVIDKPDFIFGPSYGGIPIATALVRELDKMHIDTELLYDRKETDEIVGSNKYKQGSKILIVDDVITTGRTKERAIEKLKGLGEYELVGMVVGVDRQERSGDAENVEDNTPIEKLQNKFGIEIFSILTIGEIYNDLEIEPEMRSIWKNYFERYGS